MVNFQDPTDVAVLTVRVALVLCAAYAVVRFLDRLIERAAEERMGIARGRLRQSRRFIHILGYLTALVVILGTLEIDVTGVLAGLGIGALIIGFALKDVIENRVEVSEGIKRKLDGAGILPPVPPVLRKDLLTTHESPSRQG